MPEKVGMPFEEQIISRAQMVDAGGISIPVTTREDLIVMKAVASRQRDVSDIDNLVKTAQHIDWDYVLHWASQFSTALDMPGILKMIEAFHDKYRRP